MNFTPKPVGTQFMPYRGISRQSENSKSVAEGQDEEIRPSFFGKSASEKTYFFTGSVERLIRWYRVLDKYNCFYEVIGNITTLTHRFLYLQTKLASAVSIQEGDSNLQQIILLKDAKGPVLKVIRYIHQHSELTDYSSGQTLRVVGYMSGVNELIAMRVRLATAEEISTLKRVCYINDFAIKQLVKKENEENGN